MRFMEKDIVVREVHRRTDFYDRLQNCKSRIGSYWCI